MTIGVREASAAILAGVQPLAGESLPIESALGRITTTDVLALATIPPWDASSMDGYAVMAGDLAPDSARSMLRVVGEVQAGAFPGARISAGEAIRIMTGAPVPAPADTVVRIEDTRTDAGEVEVLVAPRQGANVRARGEDFHAGDTVLEAGSEINGGAIGVLAAAGHSHIDVHRKPRVAVISSGDELVTIAEFDRVERAERIVSANNYTLCALVADAGGDPVDLGIAADSEEALVRKLALARDCDLIITSAGVSVGDHDHTRSAIAAAGGSQLFWRVRVRPGAPMAFGAVDGVPWIGLSGNPVSAIVTFEVFVRAAIRRMLGHQRLFRRAVAATLAEPVKTSAALTHFLRGVVTVGQNAGLEVRLAGSQSSGVLTAMARANALLVVPETRQAFDAGDIVNVLLLDDPCREGQISF